MISPRPDRSRFEGFTIIEVLVAIFVLAIVLVGLLSLTTGTLRFTSLSSSVSATAEDLADSEGYLSDTLKSAKAVYSQLTLVDGGGAMLVDCNLAASRCLSVLSPVLDTSAPTQPIINFDLSVFSIEPIGARFAVEGLPRGWQGEDTLTLFEYRVPGVCSASCSSPPSALSQAQRTWTGELGILLGGLAATNGDGDAVQFFQQSSSGASMFVNLVARADSQLSQPFVVRQTPVALQVAIRE